MIKSSSYAARQVSVKITILAGCITKREVTNTMLHPEPNRGRLSVFQRDGAPSSVGERLPRLDLRMANAVCRHSALRV